MKIFKTFEQFTKEVSSSNRLLEQKSGLVIPTVPATGSGNSGNSGKSNANAPKASVPEQPKASTTFTEDLEKLLKIPNSAKAYIYKSNEAKPSTENGIAISVRGVGRTYNLRADNKNFTAYLTKDDGSYNTAEPLFSGTWAFGKDEKNEDVVILTATGEASTSPTVEHIRILDGNISKTNIASNRTESATRTSVANQVASVIKANSSYFKDSDDDVVYNSTEAAFYYILKNRLSHSDAKAFVKTAFAGEGATTYGEMEMWEWSDIFASFPFSARVAQRVMNRVQDWTMEWAPEDDEDNQYLGTKVSTGSSLGLYEPSGEDAKMWAQTVWNIIDDSWVGDDEEINAVLAIMALSPKGLINVDAAWKTLQGAGIITSKSTIDVAIASECDTPQIGELVKRFASALRAAAGTGTISAGAQKMLDIA